MHVSKLIDSQASLSVSTPPSSISSQNGFQTSSGATARLASTSIRISVVGARIMVRLQRPPVVLRLMYYFRLRRVASMEFFHPDQLSSLHYIFREFEITLYIKKARIITHRTGHLRLHVRASGKSFRALCCWIRYIRDQMHYSGLRHEGFPWVLDALDQIDMSSTGHCLRTLGWQGGSKRTLRRLHRQCHIQVV